MTSNTATATRNVAIAQQAADIEHRRVEVACAPEIKDLKHHQGIDREGARRSSGTPRAQGRGGGGRKGPPPPLHARWAAGLAPYSVSSSCACGARRSSGIGEIRSMQPCCRIWTCLGTQFRVRAVEYIGEQLQNEVTFLMAGQMAYAMQPGLIIIRSDRVLCAPLVAISATTAIACCRFPSRLPASQQRGRRP